MNKVATLEEYILLNDENPLGYTYDILSCISMLVHRENSAILAHIESTNENNNVDLKQVNTILDLKDDKIINIELFTGEKTNKYNLELIKNILDSEKIPYSVKSSFIDMYGIGSIGYNYQENKYYQVNNNYELESINTIQR